MPSRTNKYIKQPNEFSCGPTALYNLFYKYRLTNSQSFRALSKHCQCKENVGTFRQHFASTLAELTRGTRLSTKTKLYPTFQQVRDHLSVGTSCVLLLFHWQETHSAGDHYVLILPADNWGVWVVNYDQTVPTMVYIRHRRLKTMLLRHDYQDGTKYRRSRDRKFPQAWFISHEG